MKNKKQLLDFKNMMPAYVSRIENQEIISQKVIYACDNLNSLKKLKVVIDEYNFLITELYKQIHFCDEDIQKIRLLNYQVSVLTSDISKSECIPFKFIGSDFEKVLQMYQEKIANEV